MAPSITVTGQTLQPESGLRRWQREGITERRGRSTVVISYLPYGFLCSSSTAVLSSNCISSPTEWQYEENKNWASKRKICITEYHTAQLSMTDQVILKPKDPKHLSRFCKPNSTFLCISQSINMPGYKILQWKNKRMVGNQ